MRLILSHHLYTTACILLIAQLSLAQPVTVSTSFEFNASSPFSIGTAPTDATFNGGSAETQGAPSLYVDGAFSWHIPPNTLATVTFGSAPSEVSFFYRNVSTSGDSTVRVLDTADATIATAQSSASFTEMEVIRDSGMTLIGQVEIDNQGPGDVVVDVFSYTVSGSAPPTPLEDPIPEEIPQGDVEIRLTGIASDLVAPNWGISAPGDDNYLYVIDQVGTVWEIDLISNQRSLFLDVSERLVALGAFGPGSFDERGLLGLAFHSDFANNGLLYTYTSEPADAVADFSTLDGASANHQSVITEWQVANSVTGRAAVDTQSARELLRIDQPQFNHNGGALNFDANGLLYIALGDGGGADDPNENGADPANPLGSVLRIDPLGSNSDNGHYGIPANNPFVGQNGFLAETYAYGFRNPYRFSFDGQSGQLWLGDVGQNDIEEIDVVSAGGHYGWNHKEGSFFFDGNGNGPGFVTAEDPGVPAGLIDPIAEYDHDEGIAIIGGFVYRGSRIPALSGRYVFGDFNGRLFYLDAGNSIRELQLFDAEPLGLALNGFGQDSQGELYVLANDSGTPSGDTGVVLRIDPVLDPGVFDTTRVWFDPGQNGQGIQIVQNGDLVGGAWFRYDESGEDLWVTFVGLLDNLSTSVDLLRFTGSPLGVPWDNDLIQFSDAGDAVLQFNSAESASFSFTLNGVSDTLNLVPFASDDSGDFTGFWGDPNFNGQGMQIVDDNVSISGAWYLYDTEGADMWLTFVDGVAENGVVTADLLRFTGPPLGTPWDEDLLESSVAGTITLELLSPYLIAVSYTIGEFSGSLKLTRFLL